MLNPADVPYLYFVSKNDGTHMFSETIEEHNQRGKNLPASARVAARASQENLSKKPISAHLSYRRRNVIVHKMSSQNHGSEGERPENLVARLAARLRNHVLWDSLLIFVPPVLAAVFIAFSFYRVAWMSPLAFLLVALALAGVAVLAVILRYRPLVPSVPAAAQLIDGQAESKDRFLTLATLATAAQPENFVARLRHEASRFGERIQLGRDFPYRFKNSFYRSLAVSLAAAMLFHFLIPVAESVIRPPSVQQQLRQIAAKMVQKESLKSLAQELQALAAKLDDPKARPEEKQAAVEELEKKIEEQQKKEEKKIIAICSVKRRIR